MGTLATQGARPPLSSPWQSGRYRLLFGVWFGANLCTWMHEAASGWLMATLGANPLQVALLQSASSLPALFLAMPSGALSDLVDRRRFLIVSYALVTIISFILGGVLLAGFASATLLLIASFAMGITLSMRLPVYAALVQEVLPRDLLPRAIVWSGASMNASRTVGPILVGAIIALGSPAYAFIVNGLISAALCIPLIRWRRPRAAASTLPSERFIGALRVGLQFARQTPAMRAAMVRGGAYFSCAVAPLALLPVVVRDRLEAGANTYTLLFGVFGLGAVAYAFLIQPLRQRYSRDQLIAFGIALQVGSATAFVLATTTWLLAIAMVMSGFAWLAVASALQVTAQLALPSWVRGRGLAAVQMAFMGGGALGSIVWGQLASSWSVAVAFGVSTAAVAASALLVRRFPVSNLREEDLTPSHHWPEPSVPLPIENDEGPVQVSIEYLIDPSQAEAFAAVMQEGRRLRLRAGASSWALFRDSANPSRYVEQFVEESWVELMRHLDRVTVSERDLRDQKRSFHIGERAPVVTYLVAADLSRRKSDPETLVVPGG